MIHCSNSLKVQEGKRILQTSKVEGIKQKPNFRELQSAKDSGVTSSKVLKRKHGSKTAMVSYGLDCTETTGIILRMANNF